jgi:hypothetical protein
MFLGTGISGIWNVQLREIKHEIPKGSGFKMLQNVLKLVLEQLGIGIQVC